MYLGPFCSSAISLFVNVISDDAGVEVMFHMGGNLFSIVF